MTKDQFRISMRQAFQDYEDPNGRIAQELNQYAVCEQAAREHDPELARLICRTRERLEELVKYIRKVVEL